ncbi:hypothetical protein FB451DRAFT_1186913 [Mycena latifolia]|nr:hypothetical protein FB451DRAFT_1186913 [Mycena latifolia]
MFQLLLRGAAHQSLKLSLCGSIPDSPLLSQSVARKSEISVDSVAILVRFKPPRFWNALGIVYCLRGFISSPGAWCHILFTRPWGPYFLRRSATEANYVQQFFILELLISAAEHSLRSAPLSTQLGRPCRPVLSSVDLGNAVNILWFLNFFRQAFNTSNAHSRYLPPSPLDFTSFLTQFPPLLLLKISTIAPCPLRGLESDPRHDIDAPGTPSHTPVTVDDVTGRRIGGQTATSMPHTSYARVEQRIQGDGRAQHRKEEEPEDAEGMDEAVGAGAGARAALVLAPRRPRCPGRDRVRWRRRGRTRWRHAAQRDVVAPRDAWAMSRAPPCGNLAGRGPLRRGSRATIVVWATPGKEELNRTGRTSSISSPQNTFPQQSLELAARRRQWARKAHQIPHSRRVSAHPRAAILRFSAAAYVLARAAAVFAAWLDERQLRVRSGGAGTGAGAAGMSAVMISSIGVESALSRAGDPNRKRRLYGFRNTAPVPSRQPFHPTIGRDGFRRTVRHYGRRKYGRIRRRNRIYGTSKVMSKWPAIEFKSTELGWNSAEGRLEQLKGTI